MRRILAAALLAATALSGALSATSHASGPGCVTQYFLGPGDDTEGEPIIVQKPDGSIEIHPPSVRVPPPGPTAQAVADHLVGFVNCVV